MILRTWRGSTRLEDEDRYLAYLRETGVEAYEADDEAFLVEKDLHVDHFEVLEMPELRGPSSSGPGDGVGSR